MSAIALTFGMLASSAQTGNYLFNGSEQTITLNPGTYNITAYGAQGGGYGTGYVGGLGAEMEGEFSFSTLTTLTILVGGAGQFGGSQFEGNGSGGGGGSFVVSGSTLLVVAGGGGGAGGSGGASGGPGLTTTSGGNGFGSSLITGGSGGSGGSGGAGSGSGGGGGGGGYSGDGSSGLTGTGITGFPEPGGSGGSSFEAGGAGGGSGYARSLAGGNGGFGGGGGSGAPNPGLYGPGGGGGGFSGGGGGYSTGGGGGGGSYIDSSAVAVLTEISGVASPDGSPNGEIIITAIPEPATLALAGLGGLSLLLFRRRRI